MDSILSKAQHTLENADLHIDHYHPCLRTDVYEKYVGNHQQMPEVFGRNESQQPEPAEPKATSKRDVLPKQRRETTDFSKNDETCYQNKREEEDMEVDDDVGAMHGSNRKESRKQHSKKEKIELKKHELDLLQQTNLHNSLKQNPGLEVIIGRNLYVIEGDDETLIKDAGIKVLRLFKDSQATTITNLEQDQIEVLCRPKMQMKLKEKFIKKNITVSFECRKDDVVVHSFPSSDQEQIKKIVTDQVSMGGRSLGADELFVLQSIKGQEFLKKLKSGDDDCTAGSLVKIDGDGKKLVVVGSLKCQRQIEEAVKTFMREYKLTTEMLDVPKEVQEYIRKFQKPEFDRVVNFLHGQGTEVQCMLADDKICLKGPEGGVGQGKTDLSELCKAVASKSFNIKLFGIKEFLGRNSGKEMKEKIEGQFSCLIKEKSARDPRQESTRKESALSKSKVASIAEMTFQNCVLHFQQGDILDTNVDAIAHAVDTSLKLKTALGKAVLSRGGQSVEAELEQRASRVGEGDVLLTSAGRLPGLKAILHVVCPVFGRSVSHDVESLQACINTCLAKADQQHFSSIAFPIIGAGRIFKFPETAAGKFLMEAIKVYLEENENTNLERIVLCDMQADNLTTLMERCKNVFRGEELETLGELKDEEVKGAGAIPKKLGIGVSYSGGKNFGHISVSVVEGELTKQKVNVIVSVVDKSLDLSRGRISSAVSEDGGSSVQRDLRSRYKDGIHSGEFAETRGGDLKCKNIFHACLPVWDHGKEAVVKLTSVKIKIIKMGKLVLKMLERADQLKAKSMAFPALGTGGLRYPADVSAHTIMDAISQFAMDHPRSSLKNISLVIFHANKDVARTFKAVHSMAEQGSGETSGHGGAQSTGKMTFGSVTLTVKNGDITDEKCDVIVNGIKQDMDLSSSGAVCKALLKKCGSGLQHDCKSKAMEMTRNGLVVTSGQGQPWKNIIHLSNEKFGHNIDQGVAKALEAAEQLRARSLALPVFGAARKGADVSHIKDMIFGAVKKFGTSGRHTLSDIRLVVFSKDMMDTFLEQGHHSHHSHHSSQSARRDHSPAPAPARVSERLDLTIYAKDTSDCEAAIKALTDACKQKFEEKKVSKDHLSQLSPKQIKEFEAFGLKHHLQVSVRTEERSVVIRGFENTDGMMEVQNKLGDLLIEAVQNLQRAIPLAIQWQYKSGHKWRDFEPLANSTLEIEYGRKSTWHDLVDARGRKYRVDFKNMKEHVLDEFGKPTGETVDIQRNDRTKEEPVPKRWDPMLPDEDLKLVFISPQSKEYKKVEQRFRDGGATVQIRKIERVQNKALYQQYAVKRREIEARNPKGHENEKILYHGTKAGSVNAINQNGFNRSYCGANATMFGEGVYFAKQSGYSVTYAEADQSGTRKMYQARVLVGESVVTKSGTKFLTNKPNSNFPYDSGTDPVNSMYIIFHDAQAVPEYLITF